MFVFKFLSFSEIRNSKPSLLWRLASLSLSSDFVFRFSHFLYPLTDISLSKRPKKTFPTVGPSYCFIKSSRSLGKSRFSPSLLFHWVSVHWGFGEWQRAAIHSVRGKKIRNFFFQRDYLRCKYSTAIIFTYLMTDVQTVVLLVSSKFPVFIW